MTQAYWIRVHFEKILDVGNVIRLQEEPLALLVERTGQTSSRDYRFWPCKTDIEEHLEYHPDPDHWGWSLDHEQNKWYALFYFIDPAIATYFKLLWGGSNV